ncbi:N-acetyltransferase [Pseudoalteromonas atlantica]|uniref:N-acetyltransferase n=1 Tax=Pseudoalteromonas atlantica TaxID=288 RepID=A0ABQ0UFZ1_PSEAF|nr:GNAT family N-acetyltransferase [Pseudoalteromonas sp. 1CM17D]MCK8094803.1 GNAT family N-acetyltransferase [Pseudoalteromonas sp. 1CM17D]GEK77378.1 N-acetyltransferase [Pseudoalteromonas atlantica]
MVYNVELKAPAQDEFANLRTQVKWQNPDDKTLKASIENSLFWVTVYDTDNLIGTGRVVGDGAMYFYIQDVIVAPSYQKQGIGHLVMTHIENYLSNTCSNSATIALLSANGKESFYTQYGYVKRDGDGLGLGMCKFISK